MFFESEKQRIEYFMGEAIKQAKDAAHDDEVPVGAVIVKEGQIIAAGRNRREKDKNAIAHAEMEAISNACNKLGGWRLSGCELFVTMEPCPMCAGAIINARIKKIYFGASDAKAGSCKSLINLFELPYNHKPCCEGGILETECAKLLSDFFKGLRES